MDGKTVLVPLDGSLLAEAALPYATAVAAATGATLRLLAVIERDVNAVPYSHAELLTYVEGRRREELEAYLPAVEARLREAGHTVSSAITVGDPTDEILTMAAQQQVAVIAMATHGRGGVERWRLGSVADKVMRLGSRPTLLIPPAEDRPPARQVELRRLLVPLDGSRMAESALLPAIELATAAAATLVLVRVEPFLAAKVARTGTLAPLPELEAAVEAEARRYLEEIRDRSLARVPCEVAVLRGEPAATLSAFVDTQGIDLVIMSTRGRGGLRRLVLGSTADRLVRSGVPSLLLRP